MEAGSVIDHTYGAVPQSEWAAGEPKYSIRTGGKMKDVTRYSVVTYRCSTCEYLESCATVESSK